MTHAIWKYAVPVEGKPVTHGIPRDAKVLHVAMQGDTPYFAKIIHLFFDMDSMVGKDFEAGLANLKASAEN